MPRVKRGTKRRAKRKKILDRASGYFLTKSKLYRSAKEAVERGHSLESVQSVHQAQFDISAIRLSHGLLGKITPNTAMNMKLASAARGEMKSTTSSSKDVDPTAPNPNASATR